MLSAGQLAPQPDHVSNGIQIALFGAASVVTLATRFPTISAGTRALSRLLRAVGRHGSPDYDWAAAAQDRIFIHRRARGRCLFLPRVGWLFQLSYQRCMPPAKHGARHGESCRRGVALDSSLTATVSLLA